MKFVVTALVLFTLFFNENLALDAENYTAYIEELNHNDKFLEEYSKWSFKLFSQPDYLYGTPHAQFPCSIESSTGNSNIPTSVHALRPGDVKCVGAIGDSFTAGLGAHAITPIGLLSENRGISWSVGGDYTYTKIVSLPNVLRQYNSNLQGFSTRMSSMFSDAKYNRLNVAQSGDHFIDMPDQAEFLIDRIKNEKLCDWNNDWKVITLFVGTNDLCSFCEDPDEDKHTPEQYMTSVRDTLDKLYNASLPRTLVNLVLTFDVRNVKDLNTGGYICQTLHKKICPCAASPTNEQAEILDNYIPQYHRVLVDLIDSGRYEKRDDFTVVIQPFMAKTKLSYKDDHTIDFSYFAPDCFHFSGKGHSQAALSLWNNMLEPVGGKQSSWHAGQPLKCPTKKYPYIFTSKNSAKALDEFKLSTIVQTTSAPIINNGTTSTTNRVVTFSGTVTSTDVMNTTAQYHHKHRKDKKSGSFSRMKLFVITGFIHNLILIIILSFVRRRKARSRIPTNGDFGVLGDSQSFDDQDDEVEIWSRPNTKSNFFDDDKTTKTHGARVIFD